MIDYEKTVKKQTIHKEIEKVTKQPLIGITRQWWRENQTTHMYAENDSRSPLTSGGEKGAIWWTRVLWKGPQMVSDKNDFFSLYDITSVFAVNVKRHITKIQYIDF